MNNKLKFIKTSNIEPVADFMAGQIIKELAEGRHVLWFIPGGSAINVAVLTAKKITKHDHHNLTVTLTDERYGPFGHSDSNWQQLDEAGFILPEAKLVPVLADFSFLESTKIFAANLKRELTEADYIIGLFGVGLDGHTAGILPNSPAVFTKELTCAYDNGNFKRITITPQVIAYFNEAVVFAQGEAKWPVLKQLNQSLEVTNQPAQILKTINKLTIFSDYKN